MAGKSISAAQMLMNFVSGEQRKISRSISFGAFSREVLAQHKAMFGSPAEIQAPADLKNWERVQNRLNPGGVTNEDGTPALPASGEQAASTNTSADVEKTIGSADEVDTRDEIMLDFTALDQLLARFGVAADTRQRLLELAGHGREISLSDVNGLLREDAGIDLRVMARGRVSGRDVRTLFSSGDGAGKQGLAPTDAGGGTGLKFRPQYDLKEFKELIGRMVQSAASKTQTDSGWHTRGKNRLASVAGRDKMRIDAPRTDYSEQLLDRVLPAFTAERNEQQKTDRMASACQVKTAVSAQPEVALSKEKLGLATAVLKEETSAEKAVGLRESIPQGILDDVTSIRLQRDVSGRDGADSEPDPGLRQGRSKAAPAEHRNPVRLPEPTGDGLSRELREMPEDRMVEPSRRQDSAGYLGKPNDSPKSGVPAQSPSENSAPGESAQIKPVFAASAGAGGDAMGQEDTGQDRTKWFGHINIQPGAGSRSQAATGPSATQRFSFSLAGWPTVLAQHFKALQQQPINHLVLKLEPENLGTLVLRLRAKRQTVTANITADNEATRQLLLQNESALRQQMEKQGFSLAEFSVNVGGQSSHTAGGNTDSRSAAMASRPGRGMAEPAASESAGSKAVIYGQTTTDRLVNIIA